MKTVFLIENPKHALLYAVTFKKSVSKNHHYIVNNEQYSDAIILYGFKKLVRLITPDEYSKEYNINKLNKVPMSTRLLDFMIIQDKSDQYKIMKQHLDEADEIIIATDPDLEDEDIARYLIRHSKNHNKNIKRFRFNSLDGNDINFSYSQIKDVSELTNREMAETLEKQNLRVPHFMIYQEVLDLIYLYFKDLISMLRQYSLDEIYIIYIEVFLENFKYIDYDVKELDMLSEDLDELVSKINNIIFSRYRNITEDDFEDLVGILDMYRK